MGRKRKTLAILTTNNPPLSKRMKNTKTIIREAQELSDEYEYYADCERRGEISRATYFRACATGDGLTHAQAESWLRENYQRAGVGHLY